MLPGGGSHKSHVALGGRATEWGRWTWSTFLHGAVATIVNAMTKPICERYQGGQQELALLPSATIFTVWAGYKCKDRGQIGLDLDGVEFPRPFGSRLVTFLTPTRGGGCQIGDQTDRSDGAWARLGIRQCCRRMPEDGFTARVATILTLTIDRACKIDGHHTNPYRRWV